MFTLYFCPLFSPHHSPSLIVFSSPS
jgi:hypothetical protein